MDFKEGSNGVFFDTIIQFSLRAKRKGDRSQRALHGLG
jgi:hypothetical protein